MPHDDYLMTLTLYRDGRLRVDGQARRDALPGILRTLAEAIEAGAWNPTEVEHD